MKGRMKSEDGTGGKVQEDPKCKGKSRVKVRVDLGAGTGPGAIADH